MDAVERFLCLASYEKGHDFLRQCAEMGVKVTLLTLDQSRAGAWPRECLEELASMPAGLNREQILNTVSWMARSQRFDRVIALHEADLEAAAQIREHFRVPGMGTTTAGCYRDKLAQRIIASAFGHSVLGFCRVLNYDELRDFMARVPAPWMLRPRIDSSSAAARKIENSEQLWRTLDAMGDAQSHYILERIGPGDLFCVDSIVSECEVKFSAVHQSAMRMSPADQAVGICTTYTADRASREARELEAVNRALAPAFGMVRGVTHAEFLRSHADGKFYFVGIGARVGGGLAGEQHAQVVEAATGVNLWRDWAKLEISDLRRKTYVVPDSFDGYAGSVVCVSTSGTPPDLESIADPAIVSRIRTGNHSGLILRAAGPDRMRSLVDKYSAQFEGELAALRSR
jgi:biotin carboxylase